MRGFFDPEGVMPSGDGLAIASASESTSDMPDRRYAALPGGEERRVVDNIHSCTAKF